MAARAHQPLDLNIAKCRMMVAVPEGFDYERAVRQGARLKVASKYIKTAREHFAAKGVRVDLIKLYGSMELAPLAWPTPSSTWFPPAHAEGQQAGGGRGHHADLVAPHVVNQAALKLKRETLHADPRCLCRRGEEGLNMVCDQTSFPRRRRLQGCARRTVGLEGRRTKGIEQTVANILADVKRRGDAAVIEYTNRFDRLLSANAMQDLELSQGRVAGRAACRQSPPHSRRLPAHPQPTTKTIRKRWQYEDADGTLSLESHAARSSVLYVPGRQAAYPSSVLMNAIPPKSPVSRTDHGRADAGRREQPAGEAGRRCVHGVTACSTSVARRPKCLAYGTADRAAGQDRRPGQRLRRRRQAPRVGIVGIDMVAGPSRNPRRLRRFRQPGLGRDGSLRRQSTTNWRSPSRSVRRCLHRPRYTDREVAADRRAIAK